MSTSQMLSMDFENKSPFAESSFDSSFNYMDSGLDYFQYPPASPNLGASVGLPQTAAVMEFNSLNDYTYNPSFDSSSPPRSYSPMESAGVAPQALTYSLTPGELSSDAMISGRISRGSNSRSPPAVPYSATVPRSHRYNPIAVPPNRPSARVAHKRRSSRSNDDSDDEDDEEFKPGFIAENDDSAPRDSRRETVRKQRIESEQRRRDELREGYSRLKESLPASNQKASKVSLLERATGHIKYLEAIKGQLEARLKGADHEVHRLRTVNEALMLNRAGAAPLAPPTAFNN
jgi:hypothetical protein